MQNIIQIYPCLLKLSRKQDTILNIDNYKPHAKNYSNLSMFTQIIA